MGIEKAVNSLKTSLVWGSWNEQQAGAVRTLLVEVEKVKLLEEENKALRRRLEKPDK